MNLRVPLLALGALAGSLLLNGCMATKEQTPPQPLWQAHQELANELQRDRSFSRYELYISEPLLGVVNQNAQDKLELVLQLAVPLWFASVTGHVEGSQSGKRCLVTNGQSREGDPISAATEYLEEGGRMKIRAVEIRFLETASELPDDVWCPGRPETFQ